MIGSHVALVNEGARIMSASAKAHSVVSNYSCARTARLATDMYGTGASERLNKLQAGWLSAVMKESTYLSSLSATDISGRRPNKVTSCTVRPNSESKRDVH